MLWAKGSCQRVWTGLAPNESIRLRKAVRTNISYDLSLSIYTQNEDMLILGPLQKTAPWQPSGESETDHMQGPSPGFDVQAVWHWASVVQVTNPAIDPYRESLVMSTDVFLGRQGAVAAAPNGAISFRIGCGERQPHGRGPDLFPEQGQ